MRNLEKMVGVHRRTKGFNKTTKADTDVGVFEIPAPHSPWVGKRMFHCTARAGDGVSMLGITCREWISNRRAKRRKPTIIEVENLIKLFFHEDDFVYHQYIVRHNSQTRREGAIHIWHFDEGGVPKVLPKVDGLRLVYEEKA